MITMKNAGEIGDKLVEVAVLNEFLDELNDEEGFEYLYENGVAAVFMPPTVLDRLLEQGTMRDLAIESLDQIRYELKVIGVDVVDED